MSSDATGDPGIISPGPHRITYSLELVEMILLELDMKTLLTSAQRVCSIWRALITKSLPLQRALFFEPITPHQDTEKRCNPLLMEHFSSFFPTSMEASGKSTTSSTETQNPSLSLRPLTAAKDPSRRPAFLYEHASWRNMLIQQPPVKTLAFINYRKGRLGISYSRYMITNSASASDKKDNNDSPNPTRKGIRMSLLYDFILDRHVPSSELFWWGNVPSKILESRSKVLKEMWEDTLACSDVVLFSSTDWLSCERLCV
ncbi:hypothetical protein BDV25DRAFT_138337 [Aspergillus avenaceus]|uniref:F-box domain-containing protein n=1 Tax=Aspergillus avenaceus TaxID=36643 RepID=A0A5N6U036_ASPAV|nr:hypothetical protein BDV25DRAFT_138337 [Aspergillus avenaceus]